MKARSKELLDRAVAATVSEKCEHFRSINSRDAR